MHEGDYFPSESSPGKQVLTSSSGNGRAEAVRFRGIAWAGSPPRIKVRRSSTSARRPRSTDDRGTATSPGSSGALSRPCPQDSLGRTSRPARPGGTASPLHRHTRTAFRLRSPKGPRGRTFGRSMPMLRRDARPTAHRSTGDLSLVHVRTVCWNGSPNPFSGVGHPGFWDR